MRINLLIFLSLLLFSTSALAVERVIKWGYSTTDIDGEFGMSSSTGGAIYIPAEVAQLYKGFTLKGVMAGLAAGLYIHRRCQRQHHRRRRSERLYRERRAGGECQSQERTLCGESGERRKYNDKESVSEIINPLFNL